MAVTIDMVRNVLTNKYLTNDGSTISFHNTEADPGEYILTVTCLSVYRNKINNMLIKIIACHLQVYV